MYDLNNSTTTNEKFQHEIHHVVVIDLFEILNRKTNKEFVNIVAIYMKKELNELIFECFIDDDKINVIVDIVNMSSIVITKNFINIKNNM